MQQWKSTDEILDFAISREEEAAQFYMGLAERMERPWMSKIFKSFAVEEKGHKKKLLEVKAGKKLIAAEQKVLDLKIGDYLTDVQPGPNMEYQEALIVAMKREKKAFKLYIDLSEAVDDENLRTTFVALAQEEAKHKLRFEIEYDEFVLTDN